MALFGFGKEPEKIGATEAIPGRDQSMTVPELHHVNGHPLVGPWPDGMATAVFAMGCFWGAERGFWQMPGVYSTAVGYAGGFTQNPSYPEVCSGHTGHTEAVLVVFDPDEVSYRELLTQFWEGHDPTQGMRQGNDVGTQYRSAILTAGSAQAEEARESRTEFQSALRESGYGDITSDIEPLNEFFYAEAEHQQYLSKNPNGYCGLGGTGVSCPVGLASPKPI